ncbi:MAG TPA: flagellar assembly protein FliW [bacterium]|nr:flagellar assembly protein FliW [bacterium]
MSVVKVPVPGLPEEMRGESPAEAGNTLETVLVGTTRFGDLLVPVRELYTMPEGMHGFGGLSRFLLLAPPAEGGVFYWWQSAEDPAIAFPCCEPAKFFPDYRIQADEADVLRLKLAERRALQVLVVVTVPAATPAAITANLLGPLVMDTADRHAWQIICERSDPRASVPLLPPRPEAAPGP